eukprot:360728-Chlamydomonas_euryale.AAC.4
MPAACAITHMPAACAITHMPAACAHDRVPAVCAITHAPTYAESFISKQCQCDTVARSHEV